MLLSDAIVNYKNKLIGSSSTPALDAKLILVYVLAMSVEDLYLNNKLVISSDKIDEIEKLLLRRQDGEPIAYIIGKKDFWDFTLSINKKVLVPRPETEILVQAVLDMPFPININVLEIGTGSGAIAIALAKERQSWNIIATDICQAALSMATLNAIDIVDDKKIKFICSDLFANINHKMKFNVIVSNPPYIDPADKHMLALKHEPKSALISSLGGLYHLQEIINNAKFFLQPGGALVLEHGYDQKQAVHDFFLNAGYVGIKTLQDYSGLDRVTYAYIKS
ncbi:MAG: peptide chain release factor N(5)-glutamine methyltransferase [Legionellales bacterium]|jgi:release factor glutamine methyltransferase|nr:peptide chain release factor N(5)-glutamine methyltransferase [Legionellales bacterium]